MPAPTLETERLTLRPHRLDDFEDSATMWADPEVCRYLGAPADRTRTWYRLLRYVGHWELLGYGYWVARETRTGRFVGELGFADFMRAIEPPLNVPEAGWVLARWCHGQGYGAEAVAAMLAWGDAHLASARTACIIDPANLASLRLADRAGYLETRRASFMGDELIVLERARPEGGSAPPSA